MNKMTKTKLENLKENDVIFAINPYEQSFDRQKKIKIRKIIVKIVIGNKIINQSFSGRLGSIESLASIDFIDDMLRSEIKGVFKNYKEAHQYLQIVQSGKFLNEVKNHHNNVRR
jgi:hypothetical protein